MNKDKKKKKHKGLEIEIELEHKHKKKDPKKKKPAMKGKLDKDIRKQRSSDLCPQPKEAKLAGNEKKEVDIPYSLTKYTGKKKKKK